MLYLFIDRNRIKVLSLKKSLLGQYETQTFSKTYQSANLLEKGKVINVDYVASAVKEALQSLNNGDLKDRDVLLILPQESYSFLRIEIPLDIAPSAIASFVKDKARSNLPINLDECSYDYFLEESPTEKYIHIFTLEKESFLKFKEALQLIELKLKVILPETVAYFKLFQKTIRKNKKENILYASYDQNQLTGFLYDSFGQISEEKWIAQLDNKQLEQVIKEKVTELEQKGKKLNRLILAGDQSERIRQDTFTKEIAVWTNPLKRIIPEFYQEYLKLLLSSSNQPFSVLSFEACVGGFIFHEQQKNFSLLNHSKVKTAKFISSPRFNLFGKEVIIFLVSFIVSFIAFFLISRSNFRINLSFLSKQSKPKTIVKPVKPSQQPKLSPTPKILKDQLNIKILNGSGTAGKASEVKNLLKTKGYQEILTDNADNFEYQQSELQVKKSQASVISILKNDLKQNVTSLKESVLAEDEAADIIIIIGEDFQ